MLRHRPGADSLDGRRIAAEDAEPDRALIVETRPPASIGCAFQLSPARPGAACAPPSWGCSAAASAHIMESFDFLLANTGVPHTCAANRL